VHAHGRDDNLSLWLHFLAQQRLGILMTLREWVTSQAVALHDWITSQAGALHGWMISEPTAKGAVVVQAAASLAGFVLIWQLFLVRRNIRGTTQDSLYAHYTEVCRLFVDKPYLRPYFYNNKPKPISCPKDHPYLNDEIDGVSEMILGLIEHAIVQRRNLPSTSWKACWEPYARERVRSSQTIREFYEKNKDWYAKALRKQIKRILSQKETSWTRVKRLAVGKVA
jgi:hypothetical protein